MTQSYDPTRRAREKACKRDRDKSHAYCSVCVRRIYGGEYSCEAGHPLGPGWEAEFRARREMFPARRPGGPDPRLVVLQDDAVSRPGTHDPWLNEVAAIAADLGFFERNRNVSGALAGIPVEGEICLDGDGMTVRLHVFADPQAAHGAESGFRAGTDARPRVERGLLAIRVEGRLLFIGDGRGSVVDEAALEELALFVSRLAAPPVLSGDGNGKPPRVWPSRGPGESGEAILAQIRQLGQLRDEGLLTSEEFEAKKAELLARL